MGVGGQCAADHLQRRGPPVHQRARRVDRSGDDAGILVRPARLGRARTHPRRLLTFALGGTAVAAPSPAPAAAAVLGGDPDPADAQQVARGQTLFNHCLMCHGLSAVAGGYAPDLRGSAAVLSPQTFEAIVRGGALEARGMPRFADLGADALADLRAFIRSRADGRHGRHGGCPSWKVGSRSCARMGGPLG